MKHEILYPTTAILLVILAAGVQAAPPEAAPTLRMTSSSLFVYGWDASTRAWALTIREAAISSMAEVIFMVDCTLLIRRRISRSSALAMVDPLPRYSPAVNEAAKSLIMGGVYRRFPDLHIGYLEGGAGWAVDMMHSLVEHFEKRGPHGLAQLDPSSLDLAELGCGKLFEFQKSALQGVL